MQHDHSGRYYVIRGGLNGLCTAPSKITGKANWVSTRIIGLFVLVRIVVAVNPNNNFP